MYILPLSNLLQDLIAYCTEIALSGLKKRDSNLKFGYIIKRKSFINALSTSEEPHLIKII